MQNVITDRASSKLLAAVIALRRLRDWLVTVPTPDGAVIGLVFVAPEAQFDRFRPTFESMLRSLQF